MRAHDELSAFAAVLTMPKPKAKPSVAIFNFSEFFIFIILFILFKGECESISFDAVSVIWIFGICIKNQLITQFFNAHKPTTNVKEIK